MATTTDLSILKINYLTQAQYDSAVASGTISSNELYFTPAEEIDTGPTIVWGSTDPATDPSVVPEGGIYLLYA